MNLQHPTRRTGALMLLATCLMVAALVVGIAVASAGSRPDVKVTPRDGDGNTTFVFRGSGWKPRSTVTMSRGVLCSQFCTDQEFAARIRTDGDGRFTFRIPAGYAPDDYAEFLGRVCFGQAKTAVCRQVSVAPPSAVVTPATQSRNKGMGASFRLVVAHFLAGRKLKVTVTSPRGAAQTFSLQTRRQAGRVNGVRVARGGAMLIIPESSAAPVGLYTVEVSDPHRFTADARGAFQLGQYP